MFPPILCVILSCSCCEVVPVARVGMRCFMCGEEKVLAEAMPAGDMAVPGFEHQILECPGCNDTERRLVFTGRVIVIARRDVEAASSPSHPHQTAQNGCPPTAAHAGTTYNGSALEHSNGGREEEQTPGERVTECAGEVTKPPRQPECPLRAQDPGSSAGSAVSVAAWVRAIEKLRSYQADLHQRVEAAKKKNWHVEFDKAWDSFVFPRHPRWLLTAPPKNIARSRRERVLRLGMTGTRRRQSPEPVQEPESEAIRRFNDFWNGLGPSRTRQQTESSAPPEALAAPPMSLGLGKPPEAIEVFNNSAANTPPMV
jgi:hypothetical protein